VLRSRVVWGVRRVRVVLETRGVGGFCRFVVGRFLHRTWRNVVYRDDGSLDRPAQPWPSGYRFEVCAVTDMDASTRQAIWDAGGQDTLSAVKTGDMVYVVRCGDAVASFGAVFFRSVALSILGLPRSAVLVGGCYTVPAHRRQGLYRLALHETVRSLRAAGVHDVYIEVSAANTASVRGIEAAGFVRLNLAEASIWFGRVVRRDGRWSLVRSER
jgi:RimJ/RimL family protein N-acetyltransferase